MCLNGVKLSLRSDKERHEVSSRLSFSVLGANTGRAPNFGVRPQPTNGHRLSGAVSKIVERPTLRKGRGTPPPGLIDPEDQGAANTHERRTLPVVDEDNNIALEISWDNKYQVRSVVATCLTSTL